MRNFLGQRALPKMEYHRPAELGQVLKLLNEIKEGYKIIAGGTDLIPATRRGALYFPGQIHMIDISLTKELNFILREDSKIRIGPTTNLSEISRSSIIKEYVPVLSEAVSQMASLQVKNIGTIGGNLCNASPAADTAPPLLVLDAHVKIMSQDKERIVPLKEFFAGPSKTILTPGEILTEIQIPISEPNERSCFIKLGRRTTFTLSVVAVATWIKVKGEIFTDTRIALGAVAPTPIRAYNTEEYLIGKKVSEQVINDIENIIKNEVKPINDVRASAEYRKDMSYILTKRAIMSCVNNNHLPFSFKEKR